MYYWVAGRYPQGPLSPRVTCYLLLVGRWAGEASAFSAHFFPVIVQPVLEHVDRSRLDNMTWQLIPCVDDSLAEGCLWLVEFQTVASQVSGY